jgi:hypothetical protein
MSELLTTGQMIDRLKIGEVAIPNQKEYLAVKRIEDGFIWVDRNTHEQSKIHQDYFRIDRYTVDIKWSIIPKYVTFSEAMKAIEEGKNVICYFRDEKIKIESSNGKVSSITYKSGACESGGGASIPFAWIHAGKWTIEE